MTGICKHDWVGDDNCAYCRNEELEAELSTYKKSHRDWQDWRSRMGLKVTDDIVQENERLRGEIEDLTLELNNAEMDAIHGESI